MDMQQLNDAIEAAKKSERARCEWIRDNRGNADADYSTAPRGFVDVGDVRVFADIVGGLQKRNHFRITFKMNGKRISKKDLLALIK